MSVLAKFAESIPSTDPADTANASTNDFVTLASIAELALAVVKYNSLAPSVTPSNVNELWS